MRARLLALAGAGALALYGLTSVGAASYASTGTVTPSGTGIWNHRAAPTTVLSAAAYRAAAATPPVVIGVDHTPPPGKNWTYTHYFPESNVNVPQGGLVLFQWDQGQTNGLHTVTLVPNGQTEADVRQAMPTITKDTDNGETDTVIPPQTNNPTDLTCSTSPTAPPCTFDGTKVASSGIIPTPTGAAFAVQIAPSTAPGTYKYVCLIHPGMSGTLNVVPSTQPATDAATLAQQAAAELNQLNAGAAAAEANANIPTSTTNADGTRTWNVRVGISVDDVDLVEYLPSDLPGIHKGDSIKFDSSGTQEPHTVSTPAAPAAGLFPFGQNQCETASGPDTPAKDVQNGPPELGCQDPTGIEQPLILASQGPSAIASPDTPASAFVTGRADMDALGAETTHTVKLTNNGSYAFFCFFHQNMGGVYTTPGYRLGAKDGGVFTQGSVDFAGSNPKVTSPVVAFASTFTNQGYWLVTADGHTYNFGDAANVGNTPVKPASPIVGAAPTPDNQGLWLVAKDGGVFALGQAAFMGSMGGKHLNAPIVGIADVFDGSGYVMVASDGGIFTFGSAHFYGSLGATHLNAPIVGIAVTGDSPSNNNKTPGYRLVASDGGVFTFNATFSGSLGAIHLNAPIVGIGGDSL